VLRFTHSVVDCASFGLLPKVALLLSMIVPFWLLIVNQRWWWWQLRPGSSGMTCRNNISHRLLIAYIFWEVWRVARSSVKDLLRLTLACLGFSNFLLLLNYDLACPCCMALVLATKEAVQLSWLIVEPSSAEASSSSASRS
jgi:riboflavin transporter FmnP